MFDSVSLVATVALKPASDAIGNVANMGVRLVHGVAHALGEWAEIGLGAARRALTGLAEYGNRVALTSAAMLLGGVPVHAGQSGGDDWITELLLNRVIDRPKNITLGLEAVDMVRNHLTNVRRIDAGVDANTIAILQVGDKWYLGLSGKLDRAVAESIGGRPALDRLPKRLPKQGKAPGAELNNHAETNALNEYLNSGNITPGVVGYMAVNRTPCGPGGCITTSSAPYSGLIKELVDITGLKSLRLRFNPYPPNQSPPFKENPIEILGRGLLL